MKKDSKNNGFKIPEGYFESFSERLMDKLSEERSVLPNKGNYQEGFLVPDGYFDGVNKNIRQKLDRSEHKVITLHSYKKYYLAAVSVAAVVLLIIGLNYNAPEQLTFEDLANSDIEAYFDNTDVGLTTYEIAEMISVDQLEMGDFLEGHLDEENVLDYLNENIDDFEALNLENDE